MWMGRSTVAPAAGRRMDLASLFCMVGQHGPAVALAVIAIVSVLAAFIIYRTVMGKRRKATAEAAATDSDGQSRGVEEREASVIQPSPGELLHSSLSSTDVSDEDLSYVKEAVDLIQSDRKIRHRQAAAAAAVKKKPSPYSPPKSEIQVPNPKHSTLGGTEEMAVVRDFYKVSEPYVEEANQSLQSDTSILAKMVVEKAGDCRRVAAENMFEDVIEEVHDNHSCLKEPEPNTEEKHGQEEKVIIAECQDDVTTEKAVFDEKTPHVSESYDDDGLQENTTTLEANTVESDCVENFIHIDGVPDPCISYCKDKELEEENQDIIDYSNYSGNSHLSPEERTNKGEEAEEECVDHQQTTIQDEMWSTTSEQETNMPSTHEDQCDHVPDSGTPAMQEIDFGVAAEVIEGLLDEEPLSTLTDFKLDAHLPHFEKQDVEITTCYQEDIILDSGADQEKENILTSDNVAFGEECDCSNVAASPALACLSTPGKNVTHDKCLSGYTIDAQNVGIADCPDLSSPHQEDTISPSLEEEADCSNICPQMPSHEIGNQPESPKNDTTVTLAEKHTDNVYDPHVQYCCKDEPSVQTITNEVFDKASVAVPDIDDNFTASMSEEISQPAMLASSQEVSVAADPETAENSNASVTVEEMSCPHLPSMIEPRNNLVADDEPISVPNEDIAGIVFGPYPQLCSKPPHNEPTDWNNLESFAANEDMFGQEIEDSYYREMDQFAAQIAASFTTFTTKVKKGTDMKAVIEVLEIDDKKAANSIENKEETKAEKEVPPHNEPTDWNTFESFAANEDMFGQEIEDSYYREMDQFAAQIAASFTTCTTEVKKDTDMKAVIEVLEIDDKAAANSIENKEETKAEKEVPPHNEPTDWNNFESFAANEDMFGQEIEDSYYREMDQFAAQIAASFTTCTTEVKKGTDMKAVIEVLEIDDKAAANSIENKEETKAEKEVPPHNEPTDWNNFESFAANEDMFGQEIEDSYYREMDQFAAQIAASFTTCTTEVKKGTDMKAVIEVLEIDDKKAANSIENKEETKAEKEVPPHNEPTDWNNFESFAANEDMFGQEIEDSYYREMDQFAAQIAASFTTVTAELKKGTDMKAVVEVLEIDDKKASNSIENKEETKAEKEEEEEHEKTEINIMEATMDYNEWIEGNNSQDLSRMNLSVPLFAQDHTKNKQFPTEECSAVTDTMCTDATEIPPTTEVKQTSTLSLVDENMENTKKVVAVPPMPQNVNVTFYVHYFPQSQYQMVAVTGNQQELGNWKGFIPLEKAKDGHWTTVVSLPAESDVEWKFVVLDKGEVCRWEECGNRLFDTSYGDDLLVHKWWGIL